MQHLDQTVVADEMTGVQIDHERDDTGAERAAQRHVGGRHGGDVLAATGTAPPVQVDARCHRPNRRQVDMIVGVHVRLAGLQEPGAAAVAGLGVDLAHMVGVWLKRARNTRPALAGRLGRLGTVGLLAGRGRQRRVVRRLGRNVQFGLERGDTGGQRGVQLRQRHDQRNQLRLVECAKRPGVHPELESARSHQIKPPSPSQSVALSLKWG